MGKTKGFTFWFTGLPSSGKSTLAQAVAKELGGNGSGPVEILDGDVVRTHLSKGLGFSKEDRGTNIRRIGWICQLLTRHGVANIAAAISPYRSVRDEVRAMVEKAGGPGTFVEVFVDCPLEICEQRDVKGFYKKARRGEIGVFTGVSDPYEPPESPEVAVFTAERTPEECAHRIVDFLRQRHLLG